VVVRQFGGPEALELIDAAVPEPGPGQVRVRVAAAAVNPVDLAVRSGLFSEPGLLGSAAHTGLGWDVAGVIDAAGPGVIDGGGVGAGGLAAGAGGLAAGDAVIGLSDRLDVATGGYAEQIVLDASAVARAPAGIDLTEAATLPLNAVTALQGLDALDLAAGQSVLVTGAAGGLGGYLTELAAGRGLRVIAVAGDADEKLVRGLGAAHFIARSARLAEEVRRLAPGGADGALDAAVVGYPALDAVRGGGRFVAFVGAGPRTLRGITVTAVHVWAQPGLLDATAALAQAGRLTPRVAATFPLEAAAAAHDRLARGGVRGRLVLLP
jgi:NADPH2:quinone reductase